MNTSGRADDELGREVVSHGPEETRALARAMSRDLPRGAVIALHGELGSGKTCFVQGLAEGLGVTQAVTSPSYTIVNEYAGRRRLHHMDLYRIPQSVEALYIGLDEYLEDPDGVTVIEWAEHARDVLPASAIHVHFAPGRKPDERLIRIVGA